MCKLKFDYTDNRIRIPVLPFHSIQITSSQKNELEAKYNKLYSKYCEKINTVGGYIKVDFSNDGESIAGGRLVCCTAEIYDEIMADLDS